MTGEFQNGKEKKDKHNKTVSEKRNIEKLFMVSYDTKFNKLKRKCAS